KNNTADGVARQLWDDMEKAQDYSFNKSHAACYALIAYRTAWLKAHHPHEYMAALISSVMNTKDRVPFYVNACHELGIEVLPPDVHESQTDLARRAGKIRFGLNAVKNVGEAAPRARPRRRRIVLRSRRRSTRRRSCCGWRRRRSASTSPSIRSRPCATSSAARATATSPTSSADATARSSQSAGSSRP